MRQTAVPVSATPGRVDRLEAIQPSAIRAVHDLGEQLRREQPGRKLIPLHFGEPDLGTPSFIVEAACQALRDGAVFYESNAGRADLREELAAYFRAHYDSRLTAAHFVVTCGGVQAIHLIMQGLLAPGDDCLLLTPAWPNFHQAAAMAGARVHEVPLRFDAAARVFRLDLAALERAAAQAPRCRLLVVNTPSNPTGYVMPEPEQRELLRFCGERGWFLLADEMYDRIVFTDPPPPSFLALREEGNRVIAINGFSKTYCMTGWRLGYLIADPALAAKLASLQEYVTSHAPSMAQVAGITALREGEPFIAQSLARYRMLRDRVERLILALPSVELARPEGAFYAFFRLPGSEQDSVRFCRELLLATGVMVAPGAAFGAGGEGWLRLCFAHEPPVLDDAIGKLADFLKTWRA